MDLMILVAVFVAILALAYFTYRNIVGLDTRLRKIEDVLKNAEVVAAPAPSSAHTQEHSEVHPTQENERIPGWGGEGPPVNVERMPSTSDDSDADQDGNDEHDIHVMDLHDDDEEEEHSEDGSDNSDESGDLADDEGGDGAEEDGVGGDGAGEDRPERSRYSSVRVSDLRDALKRANVPFPNGAKKALLVSLAEANNVELSA